MFIYEDGMPVGYQHTNFECRNECVNPVLHGQVEDAMVRWMTNLPGTSRVRAGKVGIMQGSTVDIKRLANE